MLASVIARYWPFANGSGRIVDRFCKSANFGSGEIRTRTSDGVPLTVLADDLIGRHILATGKFDHSVVQVLLDRAQPGDVLADIGANVGYVSACFLSRVPDSCAICFEPQPRIADLLERNMNQFGERAEVRRVALSDHDGTAPFHVDQDNRGASRLSESGETAVRTVDATKVFRALDKLDLMKIDVEGHELPIFKAIEGELKRLSPRAIVFEDQTRSGEIRSILKRCGYSVFGIKKKLLRTELASDALDANDHIALPSQR